MGIGSVGSDSHMPESGGGRSAIEAWAGTDRGVGLECGDEGGGEEGVEDEWGGDSVGGRAMSSVLVGERSLGGSNDMAFSDRASALMDG